MISVGLVLNIAGLLQEVKGFNFSVFLISPATAADLL
jgi:hypothetical protein